MATRLRSSARGPLLAAGQPDRAEALELGQERVALAPGRAQVPLGGVALGHGRGELGAQRLELLGRGPEPFSVLVHPRPRGGELTLELLGGGAGLLERAVAL